MKSKYTKFNISKVNLCSLKSRKNKVTINDFINLSNLQDNNDLDDFVDSLPDILAGANLKKLLSFMTAAYKNNKPLIIATGAHTIKCGLSPLINSMFNKKIFSLIALNGAGVIHDVEIAMIGETSEDVSENIQNGTFGMAKETGDFINSALKYGVENGMGYGESVAYFIDKENLKYKDYSILYNAYKNNIPVTVHVSIGTDIIHQQPSTVGSVIGEASYNDFLIYLDALKNIKYGGVYFNVGSTVILPEVFLKAVTIIRNTDIDFKNFYTANFDMITHYRPVTNVVKRPVLSGGQGFNINGHNEIMLPLLFLAFLKKIRSKKNV